MSRKLTIGRTVRCNNGELWIYIGYRTTTVDSHHHYFIKAMQGRSGEYIWHYGAVKPETLIKKFPELGED